MTTIKSYTDLEQSRKLAVFLPLESADMYYDRGGLPSLIDKYVTHESIKNDKYHHLTPCWSIAALLDVLPDESDNDRFLTLQKEKNEYCCCYEDINGDSFTHVFADNPIDACVEMILKLHELKLL